MRWSWMIAAMLGLLVLSAAIADIRLPDRPNPPPNAGQGANLVIETDANAKEARLIVPRRIVVKKAGVDVPGDNQLLLSEPDSAVEPNRPWHRSLLAGVSIALATSCAGLWLVRRRKMSNSALGLVLVLGSMAIGSAVAWANAPPPTRNQPAKPAINLTQVYSGKVAVEYVAQGDSIRLILPVDAAKKIGENPGAGGSLPPKSSEPAK